MDERAISLKRSTPGPSYRDCIICQESKRDQLYSASQQGLRSLKESSEERRKLQDNSNIETIDRILSSLEGNNAEELRWHKSCFAMFTDKGKICRLRRSFDSSELQTPLVESLPPSASSALRSRTSLIN